MWRKREIMKKHNDDDDIQEYIRPWVGLTEKEQIDIFAESIAKKRSEYDHYKAYELALKEKNT